MIMIKNHHLILGKIFNLFIKNELIYYRWEGIRDQNIDKMGYWKKFREFHQTPLVRMFYHFV